MVNRYSKNGNEVVIDGYVAQGFEGVASAFEENFIRGDEQGASVSVTVGGKVVVDLWGGFANAEGTKMWERDTKCVVFSSTKGATSFCAHLLAYRGEIDLDAPVTDYWPEYGRSGKEKTTIAMLLNHQSGVPVLTEIVPDGGFYDWDLMVSMIESQEPLFEPGSRHGYEAFTFGWLVGEVVRRVSGKSLGQFFRDEIAEPLQCDFWIGLPESLEGECAEMIEADPATLDSLAPFYLGVGEQGSVQWHALKNTGGYLGFSNGDPGSFDTPVAHSAEIGAAGGITNARGLSRMYAPLANGGIFEEKIYVGRDTLARMGATASAGGADFTLARPTRFSLGYFKSDDNRKAMGEGESTIFSESAFGHSGFGGSIGFADPDAGMSFGYVMNKMGHGTGVNLRGQSLIDATYIALGYKSNTSGRWIR